MITKIRGSKDDSGLSAETQSQNEKAAIIRK